MSYTEHLIHLSNLCHDIKSDEKQKCIIEKHPVLGDLSVLRLKNVDVLEIVRRHNKEIIGSLMKEEIDQEKFFSDYLDFVEIHGVSFTQHIQSYYGFLLEQTLSGESNNFQLSLFESLCRETLINPENPNENKMVSMCQIISLGKHMDLILDFSNKVRSLYDINSRKDYENLALYYRVICFAIN